MHFETHAGRIRRAIGSVVRLLEHAGSTSVPGLSAKPIIDIVLGVPDSMDEPAYVPPLEACGFVLRIREPDWFEHRLLRAPGFDGNLHVFTEGCEEIGRMLDFRDHLRDTADRLRYDAEKRRLAARTWRYVQDYSSVRMK